MKRFILLVFSLILIIGLIACNNKEVETISFIITFDSAGGSNVDSIEVEEGKIITRPTDPIRTGYDFVGWLYKDEEYTFNKPVVENITLIASWREVKTTVEVDNFNVLKIAVENPNIKDIIYLDNIEGDLIIPNAINFDFNGFMHLGDFEIKTNDSASLTLENGSVDGDLIIDGANLSITNYLNVYGDIIIKNVSKNSYYEEGSGNTIHIVSSNTFIALNNFTHSLYLNANNISLNINDELVNLFILENLREIEVLGAKNIINATIDSKNVLFDNLPTNINGLFIPNFSKEVLTEINVQEINPLDYGVKLDVAKEALPKKVILKTDKGNSYEVDVINHELVNNFDESTTLAQVLRFELNFILPNEILNPNKLQANVDIEIKSMRESFIALEKIVEIDDIEIENSNVTSVNEIISSYLPEKLQVTYGNNSLSLLANWTLKEGTYDPNKLDDYTLTFEGIILESPTGYHMLDLRPTLVTVNILGNDDNWIVEPTGRVHLQTKYPEFVSWDIVETPLNGYSELSIRFNVHKDYKIDSLEYYSTGYEFDINNYPYLEEFFYSDTFHIIVNVSKLNRPNPKEIYSGGDGSLEDPFIITNHEEFQNIKFYLDGSNHFKITNDILFPNDFMFEVMKPQDPYRPFSGVIDGGGNKVINLRYIDETKYSPREWLSIFSDNYGVIKNITFENIYFKTDYSMNLDGMIVSRNYGTISNLNVSGYKEGLGSGVVGSNFNTLKNITVDLEMKDSNSGISSFNHGLIRDVNVKVVHEVTQNNNNQFISGVTGHNSILREDKGKLNKGLIKNATVKLTVNVYIDKEPTGKSTLNIAGVASLNKGVADNKDPAFAQILNSEVDIYVYMHGEHRLGRIGGFVGENDLAGYIADSEARGYIEGRFDLGGFAITNYSGMTPAVLERVIARVDIIGSSNTVGGLVGDNRGIGVSMLHAQIIDSKAYGDVTGTTSTGSLIGKGNGKVINSDAYGSVYKYEENN